MRSFLCLGVFLLLGLSAFAQTQKRRLEFPGFTDATKEKIFGQIPALKDGSWTQTHLDELIRYLIKQEQYDAARVIRESDELYRVTVGRVRRISSLDFEGNSSLSSSVLKRESGLAEKTPFDPGLLVEAGEKIRTYYESLGFPKTQVDLQYKDDKQTEVGVTVVIREGPQTLLDDFSVKTPNPELERVLRSLLRDFKGEALTTKTLADIKAQARTRLSSLGFWRTDLSEPEIKRNFEESKASLTFKVDRSEQYFFEPQGHNKITKSAMENRLALDSYYSSNPNISSEIASKVRALYLSRGYARVQVENEETPGSRPFTRRILLKIQEGPLIKIEKFELSGTFSQPAKTYVQFLEKHSSEEIDDGHFVKDDLDQGLKNLITHLWNQGYLRAKVVSTRTIYNKDRTQITVLITLDEGPLTQVQKITFEGNNQIPESELLPILDLEAGKPLRLSALDEAVLKLKQHYRERGFLEMSILNERDGGLVVYNEDNTLVHLNFQIQEGPQVRVASILIEGNNITRDYVIMKELEFKKGDILTPQTIEESTSRLQRLGHFASVEIRTLEEKTQIAERTVVIKVTDRDPGLFNFGIGVNNDRGFTVRGYTGIAYRNIGGTGRGVSARLDANYNLTTIRYLERKITLGYLEPYIFDTRVRGRLNLTRAVSITNSDKRQASEVNQTTWSLEQDITSHVLVTWDVLSIATVSDFFIDGDERRTTVDIGSTGVTLDLDYRDHPFNPSKGMFTRLNTEYGSPTLMSSRTIEYTRSTASFTHYLPLLQKSGLVWANSLRGGYLKNLSDRSDGGVPYDKKGFLLGGQGTIRGFTPDEAFPNASDFFTAGVPDPDRFKLTTSAMMSQFKSELRFPIWGNIGGAAFYDGGQVKIQDVELNMGWRDSVGLAARYITPVGAASVEYAWKLKARGDRVGGEEAAVLHLSIGTF